MGFSYTHTDVRCNLRLSSICLACSSSCDTKILTTLLTLHFPPQGALKLCGSFSSGISPSAWMKVSLAAAYAWRDCSSESCVRWLTEASLYRSIPCFTVRGGSRYAGTDFRVEPDASSASYCFGAAAIAGGEVLVRGFSRTSLQGDAVVLDLLTRMGCAVVETSEGVAVRRDGKLSGLDVDMNAVPDLVPTFAAVALFADTPSRISNVAHLQYKESDRLSGLADELRKLGADITVSHDGLLIRPHALEGARLDPHDDHRLAMSLALIGLRVGGISIEEPECVRKSFPAFWEEFETLYET